MRAGFLYRLVPAAGHGIGEAGRAGQAVGRHHLLNVLDHGIDQHALERGQHVTDFGDDDVPDAGFRQYFFGQVRHVGQANQGLGARVVELVLHFPRGVQRVGVDHDQAGTHGAEHDDGVLEQIGQLNGDTIARLQVGVLLQVGRKITG